MFDDAAVCVKCGRRAESVSPTVVQSGDDETMSTVIKIFLILGCIAQGWMLIPLAWCIPMTVSYFGKVKNHEKMGMGFKICTLLFVSVVAGILMLCDEEL